MSAASIGSPAKRAIFEAMVAMAWADARIEREEVLAVQAAGRVLSMPGDALDALDAGPPSIRRLGVESLSDTERRLVYLCAAWLACVDAREASDEVTLLDELRGVLAIDPADATELRDDARLLRATSTPSTRWHEEIGRLIGEATARLAHRGPL